VAIQRPCASGLVCIPGPNGPISEHTLGVCRRFCGGISGRQCEIGELCLDVPDSCVPGIGADCPGYCIAPISP
jgi:hypothetical protein